MAAHSGKAGKGNVIAVGSSATLVVDADTKAGGASYPREVLLHNEDSADCFIGFGDGNGGTAAVTTANGMPLAPGEKIALEINNDDSIWAINAAGSGDLRYLELHGQGGQ